jgi:hypothetical protein
VFRRRGGVTPAGRTDAPHRIIDRILVWIDKTRQDWSW